MDNKESIHYDMWFFDAGDFKDNEIIYSVRDQWWKRKPLLHEDIFIELIARQRRNKRSEFGE